MDGSTRPKETANQLVKYWWVDGALAVKYAKSGSPILDSLKKGHALISNEMFLLGLEANAFHVLMLPNYCAALVEWVDTTYGRTLNILTVTCELEHADEALECLIEAARHDGANMIFSAGKPGWKSIVERHGFETKPALFMKKVLT